MQEKKNFQDLDQNTEKTRKRWLLAFGLLTLWNIIDFGVVFFKFQNGNVSKEIFSLGLIFLSVSIMWSLLLFYSYSKRRTFFLTWFLWSPLFVVLRGAFHGGGGLLFLAIGDLFLIKNTLDAVLAIIPKSIFLLFYIQTYRLRKLYKLQKMVLSEGCQNYVDAIHSAVSLDDLDTVFANSIKEWPKFERILSKEYNAKKKMLA